MGTTQPEFSAAFQGSPMKRAMLRGLKRNATVMLGSLANPDDVDVLTGGLEGRGPLVRTHAAWALERLTAAARHTTE